MGLILTIAAGMIIWVIVFALGARGFDGGMLFLVILLLGATGRVVMNLLPGDKDRSQANPDAAPYT